VGTISRTDWEKGSPDLVSSYRTVEDTEQETSTVNDIKGRKDSEEHAHNTSLSMALLRSGLLEERMVDSRSHIHRKIFHCAFFKRY
jgi:hypothetical protein